MAEFDEPTATKDELWAYCLQEYRSRNPIVQRIVRGYYNALKRLLSARKKHDSFLEVGCGAGFSSMRIQEMIGGCHFEISDHDPRYISKIQSLDYPMPARVESVYELQRKDDSFDWVLMLEVLEHLQSPHKALDEIFRVARRHVVVSVPNEPMWCALNFARGAYLRHWGNTPGHINHWSPRGLKRLLSEYGDVVGIARPVPWIIALVRVPHTS